MTTDRDNDIDLSALATAVIRQAVFDASWRPSRPARTKGAAILHGQCWKNRATALAFIDSRMFDLWCHVGGFDAHRVRNAIKAALRDGLHHLDIGHHYTTRKRAA